MNGISPITKSEDKIELITPKPLQQMTGICIIVDVLLSFYCYSMYHLNGKIPIIEVILLVIAFVVTIIAFGCKSKYVFDIPNKQIIIEGTNWFIPYKKSFCNFSDINIIGVECYQQKTRHGIIYFSYDLVFALKQQPLNFMRFATTMGINHSLNFDEINKLGQLLAKTMECRFIEGEEKRSIIASQSKDSSVVYNMGNFLNKRKPENKFRAFLGF